MHAAELKGTFLTSLHWLCRFAILSCQTNPQTLRDSFDLADAVMELEIYRYNNEPQLQRQLVPFSFPGAIPLPCLR